MKKVLLAGLAVLTMVAATACTSNENTPAETSTSFTITPAQKQDTLPSIEPAPSTGPASDSSNTIIATATGEIDVTPDIAYISVGMRTAGDSAESVQKTNDETMAKVLQAIRDVGVGENDIKTSEYSVYPEYNYNSNTQIIKGYIAVNRATVTINDIAYVGRVLEAAQKAGANEMGEISFSVKDKDSAYDIALAQAIKTARARAQVMADASGVQLGGLVSVSEGGYSTPYVQRSYDMAGGSSMESAAADIGVSAGDLKISANATVVFELK